MSVKENMEKELLALQTLIFNVSSNTDLKKATIVIAQRILYLEEKILELENLKINNSLQQEAEKSDW